MLTTKAAQTEKCIAQNYSFDLGKQCKINQEFNGVNLTMQQAYRK